ncbi:hypothetical protein QAD02_023806 [Eretmocerus hayati]|uniref:Uncharacterized protein n=1 Tax=Eretmocerus hayati TaxID=131215 RepID=A0ACC2PWW1_9HYME|nr:hypothetical protein QAD02_023806 [Eretmocerus hayati]
MEVYGAPKCVFQNCGRKRDAETGVMMHKFPTDVNLRNQWIQNCNIVGRRISTKTYVCSYHFSASGYLPTGKTRKSLKASAVPCVRALVLDLPNDCDPAVQQAKHVRYIPRILARNVNRQSATVNPDDGSVQTNSHQAETSDETLAQDVNPVLPQLETNVCPLSGSERIVSGECIDQSHYGDSNLSTSTEPAEERVTTSEISVDEVTSQHADCFSDELDNEGDCEGSGGEPLEEGEVRFELLSELENISLSDDPDIHSRNTEESINTVKETVRGVKRLMRNGHNVNLLGMIRDDEELIAFTGVSGSLLESLTNAVLLCEDPKKQKRFSNSARERVALCLCKLKMNMSFRCLAVRFAMNRKVCSRNFTYMVDLLSDILQDFIYWPTHEQNRDSMPKCFENFAKTRIVLDCTEIPIEVPNCLKCRLQLYSHYKGCETVKFLIGITPCGSISYKSKAYGGRASDKAIFVRSDLLDKLDPCRDAVMVDKVAALVNLKNPLLAADKF